MNVIQDFSNAVTATPDDEWTLGLAQVRMEMLESYWWDFVSNHMGMMSANDENNGYRRAATYTTVEHQYVKGKDTIYDVLARLSPADNARFLDGTNRTEQLSLGLSHSRLPRINVPEFSGRRDEWESFRDLFKALIHNDAGLSNVEKLYYLKTLIKGEAQQALDALQLTDDNYDIAWDMLEERFEHRWLLVYGHLTALCNLKPAREESVKVLQTLVDTLRRHRDQLRALDRPVDQWNDWFLSVAAAAMDPVTRRAWKEELEKLDAARVGDDAPRPGHELAPFETLSNFLNGRCRTATACS